MENLKRDAKTIVTSTVALFWEQAISCHQDTQEPLYELALDMACESALSWPTNDSGMVEIHATDLEAALETVILRAQEQIRRLNAAAELRGES